MRREYKLHFVMPLVSLLRIVRNVVLIFYEAQQGVKQIGGYNTRLTHTQERRETRKAALSAASSLIMHKNCYTVGNRVTTNERTGG